MAKAGTNSQLLGAVTGCILTRVKGVVRLRGFHSPFPSGPADGDGFSGGSLGPSPVYSSLKSPAVSAHQDPTSIQNLAPWNATWGTKRGKGLKVHMYWAKYFPEVPCLHQRERQGMHKSRAQKKGVGNQLKVEYIQRQHPPQIRTLYTLSQPVGADRAQGGQCK